MPVENKYQRDIVLSAIKQGGHARKQSHRFAIGIPDLLIRMPGFTAVEAEVKLVKDVMPGFERSLRDKSACAVTPKQLAELNKINAASPDGMVAWVFVVVRWRDKQKMPILVALPPSADSVSADMIRHGPWVPGAKGGFFDIATLFKAMDIPRTTYAR